jgi:phosphoglycolate phosphatase-like HAD superfamily hydrolase
MSDDRPIVCVDLDGVLNDYDGWKGADYFHPPRPGAREFLEQLNGQGYRIVVFTVRWGPHVQDWLAKYGLSELVSEVTDKKPPAHVYVDDRAICFKGDFQGALKQIGDFKAHWE